MLKKERYQKLITHFLAIQPNPETELHYNNPFELLVAVILSAQCTDKRVNIVTPSLFAEFPNAETLAKASFDSVFKLIKSINFPNNKAKNLIGMANMLHHDFRNQIPNNVAQLEKLPGVGRKTANVVTSVIYGAPNMAVDTHVFRVSKRIGLTQGKTPLEVEKDLVKNFPKKLIHHAHHWLILHGRYVCTARNPKCNTCAISNICKNNQKIISDILLSRNHSKFE